MTDSAEIETEVAWLRGWRFTAVLGGLLLISFYPVLLGGQALFYRDYGYLGYPFAYFTQQTLLSGSIPHWNPLIHCGVPHFAQWNTMVLYPGSLIYVLFPLPWSMAWFCVLHLLLGGIGMQRLGRELTGSDFAAAFGGIAFPFGGMILGSVIYPNYLVAFAWMPWLYCLLRRAWREGGRSLVPAAVVGTMQMLSGAPELILMTWMLMGAALIAEFGFKRAALAPLGRFLAVVLLVAGLSAFQLLPFFKLLAVSQRTASTGSEFWALPWWGWVSFVFPLFACFKTMQGVFVQAGQSFLPSIYLGCPAFVLALVGLFRNRNRQRIVEAGFALFCVLMAFGSSFFLYRFVISVVPIGFARFPVKAVLPLAFLVPLLAMFGLAALGKAVVGKAEKTLWICGCAVGAMIVLGIILMFVTDKIPTDHRAMIVNGIVRIILLAAAVALLVRRNRTIGRAKTLATAGVLLLVWVDGIVHLPVLNPTIPASAFQFGMTRDYHEEKIGPMPKLGQGRIMLSPYAERELFTRMVSDFQSDFIGQRVAQWGNLNMLDGLPKVNGAATLMTSQARDIEVALYSGKAEPNQSMMAFLGVHHVTQTNELLKWVSWTNSLPLVTAGQEVLGTSLDLTNTDWDPRKVVYRKGETAEAVPGATVSDIRYGAGRIVFTVASEMPTVAVVAESWDPSWRATVNGETVSVSRANHAFMLVEVPGGESRVQLAYEDSAFGKGIMLSALALVFCVGIWMRSRPDSLSRT